MGPCCQYFYSSFLLLSCSYLQLMNLLWEYSALKQIVVFPLKVTRKKIVENRRGTSNDGLCPRWAVRASQQWEARQDQFPMLAGRKWSGRARRCRSLATPSPGSLGGVAATSTQSGALSNVSIYRLHPLYQFTDFIHCINLHTSSIVPIYRHCINLQTVSIVSIYRLCLLYHFTDIVQCINL